MLVAVDVCGYKSACLRSLSLGADANHLSTPTRFEMGWQLPMFYEWKNSCCHHDNATKNLRTDSGSNGRNRWQYKSLHARSFWTCSRVEFLPLLQKKGHGERRKLPGDDECRARGVGLRRPRRPESSSSFLHVGFAVCEGLKWEVSCRGCSLGCFSSRLYPKPSAARRCPDPVT